MKQLKLTSALAVLILTACASSPGGNGNSNPPNGQPDVTGPAERVPGTLAFYGDPVQIEVPGSVRRGRPFTVTVVTYGGGCINKGETEVEVEALRAEVRPYDYDTSPTLPANGGCTADLRLYKHTATLSFEETGTAEVIFYGQQEDMSGVTRTSVTKTLEVR